jgi:hypothetical protein
MQVFKRTIDFFTLGSARPINRLLTYYLVLAVITWPLVYFFPVVNRALGGSVVDAPSAGSQMLVDALNGDTVRGFDTEVSPRIELTLSTLIILIGVIALMLPVSWVYMATRYNKVHDQQVAQILIFLPVVVAGIIIVVQHSLALAFSLAGVVAAVRFRSTLKDVRDVVFIFLAICVGFAAGVQALILAALVSLLFNVVLILTWRYDFGRGVLEPTTAARWSEPLRELARKPGNNGEHVPDRDLVIALDQKQAAALAERFDRVQQLVGPPGKKPRYNAVLVVATEKLADAQIHVGRALDDVAKRWRLDEVRTVPGKPTELCYLVRLPKSLTRDELLTAVHDRASDAIASADLQIAEEPNAAEAKA